MRFLLIALVFAFAVSTYTKENGIIVLNDDNFQELTKEYDNMFVEFYSSRVPRSLEFVKVLEEIVVDFEAKGIDVVVAKIDHSKCPKIANIYRIGGFPILYHYKKGNPSFFDGELVKNEVAFFMEKKLFPGLMISKTQRDIDNSVERGFVTLVGHFEKKSSKNYKNYKKACLAFPDYITLAVVGEAEVDVPMDTVYIYTHGEVRVYDGEMTVKELKKWMAIKSLPLIVPYKHRYMKVMFSRDTEVYSQLILFSSTHFLQEHPEVKEMFEKIAQDYQTRLFVVNLLENEKNMLDFFGVDEHTLPRLSIVRNGDNEVSKYSFKGAFEEAPIREYIEKFFREELEPFVRSEEPYPERDGNVKVLVASDFESFVYDRKVNVLVEFVVDNCKRCKDLHDDVNVLAGYFQDVSDIDVARININKNDIQGFEFQQFPTFMLFPAGDENRSYKKLEKPADLGNLMQFIRDNRVKVSPQEFFDGIFEEQKMMEKEVEVEL